jgi:hypothetical protein
VTAIATVRTCFACDRTLGQNTDLEWLRAGTMVAFDAGLGRLWVICRWCAHWSLVPFEDRWEAVEELEQRAARAPVLAATDAVALLQIGSVRALRVGAAPAREEAWWRYGPSLRGRSRRYAHVSTVGGIVATGAAVSGLLLLSFVPGVLEVAIFGRAKVGRATDAARRTGAELAADFDRRFRFGRYAWQGSAPCPACAGVLRQVRYSELDRAALTGDGAVVVRCRRCAGPDAGHLIPGAEAQDLVRRSLSYANIAGASEGELTTAVELIRSGAVNVRQSSSTLSFRDVPRPHAVALELAATERAEAAALGLEVRDLEKRWRDAETIAAIVDRELTWPR